MTMKIQEMVLTEIRKNEDSPLRPLTDDVCFSRGPRVGP